VIRSVRTTALAIVSAVVLGALGTPAATAESTLLADMEITSIAFPTTGELKVTGSYVCPSGYATRSRFDALASVVQQLHGGGLDGSRFFGVRITCDGAENEVAVRIPSSGEAFHPDLPLILSLSVFASNGKEDVSAYDRETATAETLVADIGIRSVGFIKAGVVRVTGTYVCPDGYGVDSTFALVSQLIGRGSLKIRHFDRRVVCDGTPRDIAVKFLETRAGEPFVPDVANSVQLSFGATSEDGEHLVEANDQRTLTIQASVTIPASAP
jgi:hypothetical protein